MKVRPVLRRLAIASISLAALLPRLAAACSVCGGGRDDKTQYAFVIGSIFLSVLPLALIGSAVYVLVRRARRIAAEEATDLHRVPGRSPLPATRASGRPASVPGSPAASLRLGPSARS